MSRSDQPSEKGDLLIPRIFELIVEIADRLRSLERNIEAIKTICQVDVPRHPTCEDALPRLLVDIEGVAEMLAFSSRHFRDLMKTGRIGPQPQVFGGAVRWGARELIAWVDAGSPQEEVWEELRTKLGFWGGKSSLPEE